MFDDKARSWAWDEFGSADLGDTRRTARLVAMAATAAHRPSGLVSQVFENNAERQGAYDFLESRHTQAASIVDALGRSCAAGLREKELVYVSVDGTSLTITDREKSKDFGHVGQYRMDQRGLKVITALAIDSDGAPAGVAHLEWWNRWPQPGRSPRRPLEQRESKRWTVTVGAVMDRFSQTAPDVHLCFLMDREGDSRMTLIPLLDSGHAFVIRSRYNRRLLQNGRRQGLLHEKIRYKRCSGQYTIDLPRRGKSPARQARLSVRYGTFTVTPYDEVNRKFISFTLNVVSAREIGPVPRGEKRLHWILLTNQPVNSLENSRQIIDAYCLRWRVEDFHRAWKSGACDVEKSQLRGSSQIKKWATILAAVAARAERLKHLARTTPDLPASLELNPFELEALRFLKKRQKKRTEVLPDRTPTLNEAVIWIAELGGYIHRPAQGPPGTKTIQRGLAQLLPAATVLEGLGITKMK